ncbi:Activator of Hsp90 ATPase-like protein 1-like protein [Thiocapsa sp. KS1]|nr:SRPBCC family protein [Thiocapsa sp. KS1]CRI63203.1 Activator of Hsp90 ATPase-like protein 1-like protein [Thiocapsa sp. KS1]
MPHTVRLHRVLKAPPERIYRAFIDPAAVAKWNAPDGFTAVVHEMDARVGGRYRTSFINFANGEMHSFGGEYGELVPGERIVVTDRFDDPNLPGEMVTTVALRAVSCGTELSITQEGLPDAVPPEMCYLGWQQSLELLARLVETAPPAEITDEEQ